jgi:hypothetical protein
MHADKFKVPPRQALATDGTGSAEGSSTMTNFTVTSVAEVGVIGVNRRSSAAESFT